MVVSLLMLGSTTASLARGVDVTPLVWLALGGALLLFSFGNAISGSTFLAFIYDRAPEHQRGRAVGLVWTFLLLGFSVGGIVFGVMLPSGSGLIFDAMPAQPRRMPFGSPVSGSRSMRTLESLITTRPKRCSSKKIPIMCATRKQISP